MCSQARMTSTQSFSTRIDFKLASMKHTDTSSHVCICTDRAAGNPLTGLEFWGHICWALKCTKMHKFCTIAACPVAARDTAPYPSSTADPLAIWLFLVATKWGIGFLWPQCEAFVFLAVFPVATQSSICCVFYGICWPRSWLKTLQDPLQDTHQACAKHVDGLDYSL